jgi:hypothetical protein
MSRLLRPGRIEFRTANFAIFDPALIAEKKRPFLCQFSPAPVHSSARFGVQSGILLIQAEDDRGPAKVIRIFCDFTEDAGV